MAEDDTELPAVPGTALAVLQSIEVVKPSLARSGSNPDFLSQVLAARQHLPSQRARRRAPMDSALAAYDEGRSRGLPRLPPGFFSTRDV